jgi:hypothetical protein
MGFPLGTVTVNYAVMFGVLGFAGGAIFSTILSLAEGRHGFHELSLLRFVGWGAAGGLILGGLAVAVCLLGSGLSLLGVATVGAWTLLGAGSAAGTLAIARGGEGRAISPAARDTGPLESVGGRAHRLPPGPG